MNTTLGLLEIRDAPKKRAIWTEHYPPQITAAYLSGMQSSSLEVWRSLQDQRLLGSEGDVSDAVLANVLSSVVEVLNRLIHPDYREHLCVSIQHQMSQTVFLRGLNEKRVWTEDNRSISLDHAIVLLDKRGFTTPERDSKDQKRDRVILLVVEEKKAGYVDPRGWDFGLGDINPLTLIPQILL
ncbi:hypothetical protein JCM11641_004387 [Rhodosporidiobolus odoratus]